MSKITLKVEIDEETYKQIKGDSVCSNNNECIISKSSSAYYALNAIINATPLTKCDDAVSRQAVMALLDKGYCHKEPYKRKEGNTVYKGYDTYYMINFDKLKVLPSVLPKREQGEWITQYHVAHQKEYIYCSECREEFSYDGETGIEMSDYKYCPNCGAEMR